MICSQLGKSVCPSSQPRLRHISIELSNFVCTYILGTQFVAYQNYITVTWILTPKHLGAIPMISYLELPNWYDYASWEDSVSHTEVGLLDWSISRMERLILFFISTVSSPKKAPSSGSPKKKGGKKKNPWSDSESDGVSDLSDNDMDGSFLEGVYCRENAAPRRAGMTWAGSK